jgi:hypothetical protein
MNRTCTRCTRPFAASDLVKSESKGMEAERKAAGLEGVRFLYYHCPACGVNDIFVDILPLAGEAPEDYRVRRENMETAVRTLHAAGVDYVVTPVKEPV